LPEVGAFVVELAVVVALPDATSPSSSALEVDVPWVEGDGEMKFEEMP
jgi:hypothetical protein